MIVNLVRIPSSLPVRAPAPGPLLGYCMERLISRRILLHWGIVPHLYPDHSASSRQHAVCHFLKSSVNTLGSLGPPLGPPGIAQGRKSMLMRASKGSPGRAGGPPGSSRKISGRAPDRPGEPRKAPGHAPKRLQELPKACSRHAFTQLCSKSLFGPVFGRFFRRFCADLARRFGAHF